MFSQEISGRPARNKEIGITESMVYLRLKPIELKSPQEVLYVTSQGNYYHTS